jgi:tripartite-type tricarboxylate transporter receptor subunit TctC
MPRLPRRALSGLALSCLAAPAALAQPQPLRVVFDLPGNDPLAEIVQRVTASLGARLQRPVEMRAVPGQDGVLAAREVLAAPADGNTLWLAASSMLSAGPAVRGDALPFRPREAFAPLSRVGHFPLVAITPAEGRFADAAALLAAERANPASLRLATAGRGSASHIQLARVMAARGMEGAVARARHYDGAAALVRAVAAGEVDKAYVLVPGALPALRAGRVRALYVTSRDRVVWVPELEAVPSLAEALPGWTTDFMPWFGFVARAGTPAEPRGRIGAALNHALEADALRAPLLALGILPNPDPTPEDFARFWDTDIATQRDFARAAGFGG